jgi:hypothetical protein
LDLAAVVGELRAALDREGIPFAVVGALALHTYGYSRATNDIDLLVGTDAQDPALGRLDVVYVDDETRGKIFAAARHASLAGVSVVVPKPEHLAAMKVHAMKNDPSRAFQEMADIQFLMGIPGVDRDEIRGYFEKSGQLERFREIERSL